MTKIKRVPFSWAHSFAAYNMPRDFIGWIFDTWGDVTALASMKILGMCPFIDAKNKPISAREISVMVKLLIRAYWIFIMRQELPYHLEQLLDNNRLTRCLLEWEVFERLFSEDFSIDLLRSWQKVRENLLLKTMKYSIEQRHGWIQWQEIWQNYITARSHVVTFFGAGTLTPPQILNSVTGFSRRKKMELQLIFY